jgi:RND family efflux transporter MFP subunit
MKRIIYIAIGIIVLGITVISLLANRREVEAKVYRYNKLAEVAVKVDTVRLVELTGEKIYTGTFTSNRESKIMADVQGKVISIYVNEGDFVDKGRLLVEIDNALLLPELEAINVTIEGLEYDVARYATLADSGAIQEVMLEKAVLGLKSAKAQKAKISEQIRKTKIYAPFAGVITQKMTEVGSFAAPGMPLIQLLDIHKMKFTIQVPESELKYFHQDQINRIEVGAFPNRDFNGRLIMIGSKGSPAHSYPVQFIVTNAGDLSIRDGMYGSLTYRMVQDKKSITIPVQSLIGSNLQPKVYVVQNGKARLREIKTGVQQGNVVVVHDGLMPGDIIVTTGFINLFDGANVGVN